MSGNTTIRKVVITEFSDASKVQIIQDTITPPKNHVWVATIYTGIGGADINMRKGIYPVQKKAPLTPGYCLVGTVKTNEAELVNLPEKYLIKVPACIDLQQATPLALDWSTAYGMVFESANVTGGQRVFVHGISGAVGFALVYGTASERNHEAVRAQGATPFVYSDKNWIKIIKDLGSADAVLDPLVFKSWDESLSILTASGVIVAYGGNLPSLNEGDNRSLIMPLMKLLARGMVPFSGKKTRFYDISRDSAIFEPNLKELFNLLAEVETTVWDLEDVPEANRQWTSTPGVGSVILRFPDSKGQD
ncbi:hypothetical protein LY76DRAFT_659388 [Colletotrichum caudatum]|nr:hypothetical protein LY76DRAFT_659388 [Colletotrichum caudatum]